MDDFESEGPTRDVFLQVRSAENPGLYDDEDMSGRFWLPFSGLGSLFNW